MKQAERVRLWAVLVWIAVWQLASMAVGYTILLPSPLVVLKRLSQLIPERKFWLSIANSFSHIAFGFVTALAAGIALAVGAHFFRRLRELLAPLIRAMLSVPVVSFIILALIWVSSANLSPLIVFIMAFPVLYANVLNGIEQIDGQLMEMAQVFEIPRIRRARCIALRSIWPPLLTGCEVALGLSWKAGIAAEVIGMPRGTIGERLQQAKVYLDTPDLFAWTIVIIAVSQLSARLSLILLAGLGKALSGVGLRRRRHD